MPAVSSITVTRIELDEAVRKRIAAARQTMTIEELAAHFKRGKKAIKRILAEQGVA
jgi:hypothetical protein